MELQERKLVFRGITKYLEQRIERTRATGFIDDVLTVIEELGEKTLVKKKIRIYDITLNTNTKLADRLFHLGSSFEDLNWKRNSKIEFDGTVYKLEKCKGKNDQKPGKKEIWEIRNPRNVKVVEFETNNRFRQTKQRKHRTNRKNEKATSRRKKIKAIAKEQRADLESAENSSLR